MSKSSLLHILLWGVMMVSLDKLNINERAKVVDISDDSLIKRRLLDIGIIPGIEIEKSLISSFKGMSAYLVSNSLIGIRDWDASYIEVEYV